MLFMLSFGFLDPLAMRDHQAIISDLNYYGVTGEVTANRDLEYLFQGAEGYTTGREIYPEIIDRVMQADPGSKLYLS